MGISEGFFDYWKSGIIKFNPACFSKHWVLKRGGVASPRFWYKRETHWIHSWRPRGGYLCPDHLLRLVLCCGLSISFEWVLVQSLRGDASVHCAFEQAQAHTSADEPEDPGQSWMCIFNASHHISCNVLQYSHVCQSAAGSLQAWDIMWDKGRWDGQCIRVQGAEEHMQVHLARAAGSPRAAKESQSSFVFWPMLSWTV